MKKGEKKKRFLQNEAQEEVSSNSEPVCVYEFFISENKKKGEIKKTQVKEKPKEEERNQLKHRDQSAAFFLPDHFTHDD
jgi:hypothetical protein